MNRSWSVLPSQLQLCRRRVDQRFLQGSWNCKALMSALRLCLCCPMGVAPMHVHMWVLLWYHAKLPWVPQKCMRCLLASMQDALLSHAAQLVRICGRLFVAAAARISTVLFVGSRLLLHASAQSCCGMVCDCCLLLLHASARISTVLFG